MPKRIGFLYEQVMTLQNCTAAVLEGTANLKKTPKIRRIRKNPEIYGQRILDTLAAGWIPEPTREKIINEGTGHKIRHLQIPSTRDHLIHVAIMRPILKQLEKRFDFYSCGSIPDRGQKRVNDSLRTWMGAEKPPKYGAEADVHHAYESTQANTVMYCLHRFIKDEKYLAWHRQILNQMGGHLAIGFQPSHWYFNLVLTPVDAAVRAGCKGIKMVRYMDNYAFAASRKRTLHRAVKIVTGLCARMGMSINTDWQVYQTKGRPIVMLSYRYFPGYTILRKQTMYVIAASIRVTAKRMNAHLCRAAMSHIGLLRHCNSYNFRRKHVYPILSIKRAKELISRADKKRILLAGT